MRRLRREAEVARIREHLLRFGSPRLRMLLLVLLTGTGGLLASYLMLRAGLASMPLRYLLAMLAAYAVFLLLLRWFIHHSRIDHVDAPNLPQRNAAPEAQAQAAPLAADDGPAGSGDGDGSWLDGAGNAGDEALLALLLIAAALVIACAALWLVFSAPTLFAELVVDGALSATLYRRLRRADSSHWLQTALRHTIIPFALSTLAIVAFALVAQHLRPHAHSIGEVFAHRDRAVKAP